MTTPLVQSISDGQLAEIEKAACRSYGETTIVSKQEIASIIARLRAAEADAKRYQRFRHNTSVNRGMSHAEVDEEFDTAMQFVEEAMEQKA